MPNSKVQGTTNATPLTPLQQARQQYATAPRTNEAADLEEQQLALDLQDLEQQKAAGKSPTETAELEIAIKNRQSLNISKILFVDKINSLFLEYLDKKIQTLHGLN